MVSDPNENWRGACEAGIAIQDKFGAPLIQYCHAPGRWFKGGLFGFILCEEHEYLKQRWSELAMQVHEMAAKKKGKTSGSAA